MIVWLFKLTSLSVLSGVTCEPHPPITAAGLRSAKLIKWARLLVVKDGPHCVPWTHSDEVNAELLGFLGKKAGKSHTEAA